MTTIFGIIVIFVVVVGMVFYAIGATNHTTQLPKCCLTCMHEHNHNFGLFTPYCCDHYGIGSLRSRVESQERIVWELRREFELNLKQRSRTVFYSPTIEQQKVTDQIVKSAKSAEKLTEELYGIIKE